MATKQTKFMVGLFIISGLLLMVVSAIWLGATRFLSKGQYAVTFFDESVQGLSIDAPVKYRGVMIGLVDKIEIASDGTLIKVTLKLELDEEITEDNLSNLVSQLRSVGITGSMFVELDRPRSGEELFVPGQGIETEYHVIPSKQSEVVHFFYSLSEMVDQIKKLNIPAIGSSLLSLLEKLNNSVDSMNLQELTENIKQFSVKLNKAVDGEKIASILDHTEEAVAVFESVLKSLPSNSEPIADIIAEFYSASQKLNRIFAQIESVTDKTEISIEAVTKSLIIILQRLEYLIDNMEEFTAKIADQPSQLFLGGVPPKDDRN